MWKKLRIFYFYCFFCYRENKQGTGGELVEEFAAVIKALWMGQYKSFYPRDFKVCWDDPVCIV